MSVWVGKRKSKFVKKNFKKVKKGDIDTEIKVNNEARAAQFNEMGRVNMEESVDLDQPIKGVHDVYDDYDDCDDVDNDVDEPVDPVSPPPPILELFACPDCFLMLFEDNLF